LKTNQKVKHSGENRTMKPNITLRAAYVQSLITGGVLLLLDEARVPLKSHPLTGSNQRHVEPEIHLPIDLKIEQIA
jgi:hypothetical protein